MSNRNVTRLRRLETLSADPQSAITFALADEDASGNICSYRINRDVVDRDPGEELGVFQARVYAIGRAAGYRSFVLFDRHDLAIL
jgi:hypothetical protein